MLNCLGEGEYSGVLKHFLQRFPPGADRFEGVEWSHSPATQQPVLGSAIAFMECKVGGGWVSGGEQAGGCQFRVQERMLACVVCCVIARVWVGNAPQAVSLAETAPPPAAAKGAHDSWLCRVQ